MGRRLDQRERDFPRQLTELLKRGEASFDEVAGAVRTILADVKARGDRALEELTARHDGIDLRAAAFRVSEAEIDAAMETCSKAAFSALRLAAERIAAFHARQLPEDLRYRDDAGAELGWRWTPLDSVGLYVPGGTASYPSSVLMNALPARTAGVKRIAMTTPATAGTVNPVVLAAARVAGVTEIYRLGGAQAIGALAYGTETIARVDKIVGPGNAYVACAKREVFGQVGIDSVAGPSEVLIIADELSDPEWVAADLLAQAEHDASAQAILVTDSASLADRVEDAVNRRLRQLPRRTIAEASWRKNGAIILVSSLDAAAEISDQVAPEHLELSVAEPEVLLAKVRHAGAIFLGRNTPEALGDYIAGPNHVLPTAGTARFSSGLSVFDFLKRSSILCASAQTLSALGAEAIELAEAEGLDAHAASLAIRLNARPDGA
ncbi:MAG: histidinol dehydrogenase [Alphaproteobacteria bacterium]|nr:histidinol dehydrogenase [Alphaproteobacteria bacterium]